MELIEQTPYCFRIEPRVDMRVPGVIFASRALLPEPDGDESVTQMASVAELGQVLLGGSRYAVEQGRGGLCRTIARLVPLGVVKG